MIYPLSKKDKADHRAFYDWIKSSFSHTYLSSQNFTGLALRQGGIGFSFPLDGTVHLSYYLRPPFSQWHRFNILHVLDKFREENNMDPETYTTNRKQSNSLQYRIDFWKTSMPLIIEEMGEGDNLRLIAQIAVILDYELPMTR